MNSVKKHKIIAFVIAFIVLFGLVISMPSLAKLKNRNTIYSVSSWDGSVATSYKKGNGTKENPYIISNGPEFAFFIEQLKITNYDGVYFELNNDIVLNSGIFSYDKSEGLKYSVDNIPYYVKEYDNEYFTNSKLEGSNVGTLNSIAPINDFKGSLNGNSFTIFGLYITDSVNENLALFKNLEGSVSDLYIKNSVIYGIGNVAGIASNSINSTISNVVFDGEVVNKSLTMLKEINVDAVSIPATIEETITQLKLPQESITGGIKSIRLTGSYEITNSESINTIKINGIEVSQNKFEIDLTANQLSEIPISIKTDIQGTSINFSNLKYIIEYYDDITSGIVAVSTNMTLNNVINKANIYGNYISSGFVGKVKESLKVTQSYNTGNINSEYISGGIVGEINNNSNHTTITNVYNKGEVIGNNAGAILGLAQDNTGLININNSFNVSSNYAINTVVNSTINVINSYSVNGLSTYSGTIIENFKPTTLDNLYTKDFMTSLSYNEFISFEDVSYNSSNAWIYENDSLPILYIDDLNNPIANINLSKYSWNNLSTELDIININNSVTFSIDDVSVTNPVKEKYYYVTTSRVPLTETQLSTTTTWIPYENEVVIDESGYYVIYAKIIDNEGKITYMNTDVIAINLSGFQTNITMGDIVWNQFKTNLDDIYVNEDINLTIYAHDDLITINSVEYYISNKELTEVELNNIANWITYDTNVLINTKGKYVIYAKIIDGEGNITYINTDYILYNGYKETLNIGNSNNNYETNYITNKSSIKLTFESDFEMNYKEGYSHNLISNVLLPIGTKMTLIDKNINKVYTKTIDTEDDLYGYNNSCEGVSNCSKFATYKFNIFEESGISTLKYYDESINYNKTVNSERYIIIIDFKNTNLIENYYDLSFYLAIKNESDEYLYKTLNNTINNINIYSSLDNDDITTTHNLNSDYSNQTIYYNSNSELNINLTNALTYSTINNKNIIDTNYQNKKSGLLIKLYNSDGAVVNKKYLDNMIFEVDGKEYFADNENSIRINLGSVANTTLKTLKIKTKENSSDLANGTYTIKISKYISDDGYYYDSLYDENIEIPLIVNSETTIIPNYSFDVVLTTDSVIVDKKLENHLATFNVVYSGSFKEPNIRVSLHQKDEPTAYNQNYSIINLQEYSSDTLVASESNKYFVDVLNPILNINLIPNKFSNNGYKYVFELYDGSKKISAIEKYFIIK